MNQLARIFEDKNDRAISFDKVEVKFNLNQKENLKEFTLKYQKMPII
jgi:hypothetical protein